MAEMNLDGCERWRDDLPGFAAGGLDAVRHRDIDAHLASCEGCRGAFEAVLAVRSATAPVPDGLETRIREAVRAGSTKPQTAWNPRLRDPSAAGSARGRAAHRWRPWAVPVAAAAAIALVWVGVDELQRETTLPVELTEESYLPFGAWPAADGQVAGDPLLSELSEEQLEQLLEEMQS